MFGLMLLGIVVLWVLVTILIARWLGKKLPDKPWRKAAQIALFPLVFVVPIFDEIIAWPQMQMLCAGADGYQYAQGMTQEKAAERTVYGRKIDETKILFPFVWVNYGHSDLVDVNTNELILTARGANPTQSLFAFPDAGGGRHTWLLGSCPKERDQALAERTRLLVHEILKLKIVEKPKSP